MSRASLYDDDMILSQTVMNGMAAKTGFTFSHSLELFRFRTQTPVCSFYCESYRKSYILPVFSRCKINSNASSDSQVMAICVLTFKLSFCFPTLFIANPTITEVAPPHCDAQLHPSSYFMLYKLCIWCMHLSTIGSQSVRHSTMLRLSSSWSGKLEGVYCG